MNPHPNVGKAGGGGPNIGISIKQVKDKSMDEQESDNDESSSFNRVQISKFGTREYHKMQTKDSDNK